jgi:SRSO17 transposase
MKLIVLRHDSNGFKPYLKPTSAVNKVSFHCATHYLKGLMQVHRKNMERMEEVVAEADDQRLPHMLTESQWGHRAVLDQVVAQEADHWLGGTEDSCLLIDESGFAKSASIPLV